MTGTIATLMIERGFGFISADGGRYFFHLSALERGVPFVSLFEGQRVSFEPTEGVKGPRAEHVRLTGE